MAKMRIALLIGILSVHAPTAAAQTDPIPEKQALLVSIVAPNGKSGAMEIPHHEHFTVTFTNRSDKPIRLWDERTTPGCATLSFRISDQNGNSWTMRSSYAQLEDWADHYPKTNSIAPGLTHTRRVFPSSTSGESAVWQGVPEPNTGETLALTVVFEIKPSEGTREHGVWTGRVQSSPIKVQFLNRKLRTPHEYLWSRCPKQALAMMKADRTWIQKADKHGYTALHLAARLGLSEVVEWLLAIGVDVNDGALNGFTALQGTSSPEVVALLIKHKANLEIENQSGRTALMEASSYCPGWDAIPDLRWRKIAKLLLDAGAHYDVISATHLGDMDRVRAILKQDPKAAHDKSLLRAAVMDGRAAIVKLLLDHKTDPNVSFEYLAGPILEEKPLQLALRHPAVVKLLLEAGADPRYQPEGRGYAPGGTLLHLAAQYGELGTAKLLLAHGAHVHARTKRQHTPVDSAVMGGHLEMVRFLLENKIVATALPQDGPAMMKSAAFNIRQVESRRDREQHARYLAIIDLLHSRGVPIDLYSAISIDNVARVKELLKSDPALAKSTGVDDRPVLHRAVTLDRREIANLLLNAGANPNQPDADGYVAFHSAAFWGREKLAQLLIRRGADVNARAKSGFTPLHESARLGTTAVARLLLAAGAKVNATDNEGRTPLSWAGNFGQGSEMVDLLIEHGGRK